MKKSMMFAGAAAIAMLATGCAGVAVTDGMPSAAALSPNFYSQYKAGSIVPAVCGQGCEVVARNVVATAVTESFFGCINLGDASYATLKAAILAQAPGANEITDVQVDYEVNNILGVNKVTTIMTATAIKK